MRCSAPPSRIDRMVAQIGRGHRLLVIHLDKDRVDRVLDEHCETGEPIEDWVETY